MTADKKTRQRCGAKARSREGLPCLAFSLENGRCRYHGGITTRLKHGRYTVKSTAERSKQRQLINEARNMMASLNDQI